MAMAVACKFPPLQLLPSWRSLSPYRNPRFLLPKPFLAPRRTLKIRCAAKRAGKRRYPSEKKKLRRITKTLMEAEVGSRKEGFWRLSKLGVPASKDPGKDFIGISPPLLEAIAKVLEFPVASLLPEEAFSVVRKSFDARKVLKEPEFVYTVDMDVKKLLNLEPRTSDFISQLEPKLGAVEYMANKKVPNDLISMLHDCKQIQNGPELGDVWDAHNKGSRKFPLAKKPKVAVIGSGPSGLFASLVLGELGAEVTLIERGQAVEQRGRDIGALIVRRLLHSESNFCFGEGGAGTWSDGKLVTRIGRNSDSVQAVMKTLVHFGAPPKILIDGKPHLGTDRLIPLLRNFRQHLKMLGVDIKFGTRLNDLIVEDRRVLGVKVSDSEHEPGSSDQKLLYDAVVLAVGHSARDVYRMLHEHNVDLIPKDFAVGLRIEHPQELINRIQYSALATEVREGRGKVPVADYKVVKYLSGANNSTISRSEDRTRSSYSFCMCPGGQVVLTSTNPSELCINGMSFSRRASRWANSALVVTVSLNDFDSFGYHGPLSGIEFQREFERRAATMGGGNFIVPAQTVTDFLDNKLSVTSLPTSSYRLGVLASNLHELFPAYITQALQHSILMFDKELPGFICKDALLHGVETRTSSPVQILRHADTYESTSIKGLYPIGEGAGYAGGIVSAAVDVLSCGLKEISVLRDNQLGVQSICEQKEANEATSDRPHEVSLEIRKSMALTDEAGASTHHEHAEDQQQQANNLVQIVGREPDCTFELFDAGDLLSNLFSVDEAEDVATASTMHVQPVPQDEVWGEIQRNYSPFAGLHFENTETPPPQPSTVDEMAVDDFYARAGVFQPPSALPPCQPYGPTGFREGVEGPSFGATGAEGYLSHVSLEAGIGGVRHQEGGGLCLGLRAPTVGIAGSSVDPMAPDRLNGGDAATSDRGKRVVDRSEDAMRERRWRRTIKHREYAARSRARKQAYMAGLEANVERIREENSQRRENMQKMWELLKQELLELMDKKARDNLKARAQDLRRNKSCLW